MSRLSLLDTVFVHDDDMSRLGMPSDRLVHCRCLKHELENRYKTLVQLVCLVHPAGYKAAQAIGIRPLAAALTPP